MSRFWIALSLLLSMLGRSLVNAAYLTDMTESITLRLQAAEEMAEREAWDQADTITTQCLNDWNGYHTYLHIISRHSDTDAILISFRSVLQSLKLREMDEYAAANLELITQITLLAEIEQPDWLNVL